MQFLPFSTIKDPFYSSLFKKYKNAVKIAFGTAASLSNGPALSDYFTFFLMPLVVMCFDKLDSQYSIRNTTKKLIQAPLYFLGFLMIAVRVLFTLAFLAVVTPVILLMQAVLSIGLSISKDMRTKYLEILLEKKRPNEKTVSYLLSKGVSTENLLTHLTRGMYSRDITPKTLELIYYLLFTCNLKLEKDSYPIYADRLIKFYKNTSTDLQKEIRAIFKLLIEQKQDRCKEVVQTNILEILLKKYGSQVLTDMLREAIENQEVAYAIYLIIDRKFPLFQMTQEFPIQHGSPEAVKLIHHLYWSKNVTEDISILRDFMIQKGSQVFQDPSVKIENIFKKAVTEEKKVLETWFLVANRMKNNANRDIERKDREFTMELMETDLGVNTSEPLPKINEQEKKYTQTQNTPAVKLPKSMKEMIGKKLFNIVPFSEIKVDENELADLNNRLKIRV